MIIKTILKMQKKLGIKGILFKNAEQLEKELKHIRNNIKSQIVFKE